MKRNAKKKKNSRGYTGLKACLLVLSLLMLAVVILLRVKAGEASASPVVPDQPRPSAAPIAAVSASPAPAVQTEAPDPTPTPEPEPEPEYFTISMVGDCTLWSNKNYANHPAGFAGTVNGDYAYPFSNVFEYTGSDDLTLANLECILSDKQLTVDFTAATFAFIAPTEYAYIMTEGGVDFVTIANNHIMDCYEAGMNATMGALNDCGLPYGTERQSQIVTTESGLKVGIYTAGVDMRPDWKKDVAVNAVKELREQGAEYVICMFHWGNELYYSPFDFQVDLAHACVDAGADVIYGSHSHCLQPVEEYNGVPIFYSMGNWSFGGNTTPSDPDTVFVQLRVKRDVDGTVSTEGYDTIPCCVSSRIDEAMSKAQNYNDYRPTPYPEDSEGYARVMAKLSGEFKPDKQGADYSNWYASLATN